MGMFKYKDQVIIAFLNGDGDGAIKRATTKLLAGAKQKHFPSKAATVAEPPGLLNSKSARKQLQKATVGISTWTRVYLLGHGDWESQKLGGWSADQVAKLLSDYGLKNGCVVSIIGCELARDATSSTYGKLAHSTNSFASNLHKALKKNHNLSVTILARVREVMVMFANKMSGKQVGRKEVTQTEHDVNSLTHKFKKSKLMFWWEGELQMRNWVNYVNKSFDEIEEEDMAGI